MQLRRDVEDYLVRIRDLSELQSVVNDKDVSLGLLSQAFC